MSKVNLRTPFYTVNAKSYAWGKDVVDFAKAVDKIAEKYDVPIHFYAQLIDIPEIVRNTEHILVSAQYMDSLKPGPGMGHVLPEALKEAGVKTVVLNHAEKPIPFSQLSKTIKRAREVGIMTAVAANSLEDVKAVAQLNPDAIICEEDEAIGTGETSGTEYMTSTTKAVREINPDIKVIQGAGITTGEDVYKVIKLGADGTGAASGAMMAKDRVAAVEDMVKGLVRAREEQE